MDSYRVLLHTILPLTYEIDGEPALGFYVTRFVLAADADAAASQATELLRSEEKFARIVEELEGAFPDVLVEEVEQLAPVEPLGDNRTGYVFYEHEDDEEGDAA